MTGVRCQQRLRKHDLVGAELERRAEVRPQIASGGERERQRYDGVVGERDAEQDACGRRPLRESLERGAKPG